MAAEGFETNHAPQLSKRVWLRGDHTNFLPNFYNNNPSFLLNPSDFLLTSHASNKHKSMDPQLFPSIQHINNNPFLYNINQNHHLSNYFHHHDVHDVVYKQEQISPSIHDPNNNTGQGLSLSLSSHNHQQSNTSSSTAPLVELNSSLFTTVASATVANNNELSSKNSTIIVGPFSGYGSILKGSIFLKPAQQLMEEVCGINYAQKLLEADDDSVGVMDGLEDNNGSEYRRNKSNLISMLHEVNKRYKQYYQQLQGVVASFESVPGLENAAPFANLSLKAMSKHFRCLKNAISEQMHYTINSHTYSHSSKINCDDPTSTRSAGKGKFTRNNFQRVAIHNAGLFVEHHQPVWQSQRGLPDRAVTVLRAWLFDHFLHPYPTDSDKVMLAKQTGLSKNQVSNWFINARVRLWKPMVEEIHMLETRQANNNNNSLASDQNPSTSSVQQVPLKRSRNNDQIMNSSYHNCLPRPRVGIDQVMSASTGGNGGVSLTLGLHHHNNNNGIGNGGLSSEPFPRNAARRFGIDANSEGFMFATAGFQQQNRYNNNIIGGQLVHDFVG